MEEVELGISKPSQFPMSYRRSHLRSHTYHSLLHIFSHLSSSTALLQTPPISVPDIGSDGIGLENQGKEPECSGFDGSCFMDPKDCVSQNQMQEVHATIEEVGDKSRDFSASKMVLDDIEFMMRIDETSTQANGFDKEQRLMDELDQVFKASEDSVCRSGAIPLNRGLDEKQENISEFELMDFEVNDIEFLHSDVKVCGNASQLQLPGEPNQLASEGFDLSSMSNVSTSTEGQASASVTSSYSLEHESQHKQTELVKSVCAVVGSLPTTEEVELEKDEQCGQKVAEAMNTFVDMDMNREAFNMTEDGRLLDSAILKDNHEKQNEGEKLEKLICVNNAMNLSNILTEKGDIEEGEISGDLEMDGNSFHMSSEDTLNSLRMRVDEVQKPKNVTGNMVCPCKTGNDETVESYRSNSLMVNAHQDASNCRQVEPRTSDEKGSSCGIEAAISHETIVCDKAGECDSLLKCGNSKDKQKGCEGINGLPTNLTQNQVLHRDFLEENAIKDLGNSSAMKQATDDGRKRKHDPGSEEKEGKQKLVDASKKTKRGPVSEGRKERKKMKYRKKRAKKNREQGVKRLKLQTVQKPKTVAHCRHYLKGRCHEGDNCKFSHDVVPLTKSKPCTHFARHSCMKGNDCPFDHQLSKYPCINFVSKGSCSRGDTCMFSHQVPTNQDVPTPLNICRPELKSPLVSGNTNFSTPLNHHGSISVQQDHLNNSAGIHSRISTEHKVTDTVQKRPTAPKGISFINFAKLSPSPSSPKQGMVTTTKESPLQTGTHADQSTSGTTRNKVEIPNKFPAVTPKGINFLSFVKGSVCSFKSATSSHVNREIGNKLPQLLNFGLPGQPSSSLDKDDYSRVSDRTKQNVPESDLISNEILDKNKSVAERINSKFLGIASLDDSMRDHSHCKSVQERKRASDNSQASNVTSAMCLIHPFVSNQSSERLVSGYHKHASNSGQRAFSSTLAFAAEHESGIKMKYPTGAPPV